MYIKKLNSTESFLEKYKKYHNKFKYLGKEFRIYERYSNCYGYKQNREDRDNNTYSEPCFKIYMLSIGLTDNTYFYDKNSKDLLINGNSINELDAKFKTFDDSIKYIETLPKNTLKDYVFLVNKQQNKIYGLAIEQRYIVDVKKNEFLISYKEDCNLFRQQPYIPIDVKQRVSLYGSKAYCTRKFLPIININTYEKLKDAIILSKYGASNLTLTIKIFKKDKNITKSYEFYFKKNLKYPYKFFMVSKELKGFDEINYTVPKTDSDSPYNKHFIDGLNVELANFSLFVNSFFIKYPSNDNFEYLEITAETKQITTDEFQDIFKQYGKKDYASEQKFWVNDIGNGFYNKDYSYDYIKIKSDEEENEE